VSHPPPTIQKQSCFDWVVATAWGSTSNTYELETKISRDAAKDEQFFRNMGADPKTLSQLSNKQIIDLYKAYQKGETSADGIEFVFTTAAGLVYEGAPYHGSKKSGGKSAGPKNGQAALDNSVQVKGTSPRRAGIDKANNEIVVFDQHSPGKFHGHVREWGELTSEMQNALKNAGLTNASGNIIP